MFAESHNVWKGQIAGWIQFSHFFAIESYLCSRSAPGDAKAGHQRASGDFGAQGYILVHDTTTLYRHGPRLRFVPVRGQRELMGSWCLTHRPSAALPWQGRTVHAKHGLVRVGGDENTSGTGERLHHQGRSVRNVDRYASLI